MRSPLKALPLVLHNLDWNWRLTLIMFCNLYPLSNTSFINLERAQFLCYLIKGAQIDIMLTYFRPWEKWQADQLHECVFLSVVLSWRSWFLKVFVHQKKELCCLVNVQFQWCHSKWARVTPLLKGQSKVPPKLQRVTPPIMPLLSNNDQLLPLSLDIPWLHFLTLLSRNLLAFSWDHLVLNPIGWQSWLRVYISIF